MASDPLVRNNVKLAGKLDAKQSIVFVNGLGTDQRVWSALAAAFEDTFRLVLFDHVGSIPASFESFSRNQLHYLNASGYAQDLLEICAILRLSGNTILIGHSLGAVVGMLASIRRPEQFSRLVLIGASPRYVDADGYRGGFSAAEIEAIYDAIGTDYQSWANAFASAAIGPRSAEHVRRLAESLVRVPKEMMLTVLCSILQADHRAVIAQLRVPTLIVQSRMDHFVPMAVAEYLLAHIPASELKVIDAEGHLPHVTAPEKLIQVVGKYIESC
ncbi:MAG: alpha/beta hydrolase [Pseudomonadota bacterium]